MLSGGEAYDCPVGTELIEATEPAETLLGDKAYDSGELRESLNGRITKAVILNRSNRKKKFGFSKKR